MSVTIFNGKEKIGVKYYGTYKKVTKNYNGDLQILNSKVYEYSMVETALLAMAQDFKEATKAERVNYGVRDIFENSITVRADGKSYVLYAEEIS